MRGYVRECAIFFPDVSVCNPDHPLESSGCFTCSNDFCNSAAHFGPNILFVVIPAIIAKMYLL